MIAGTETLLLRPARRGRSPTYRAFSLVFWLFDEVSGSARGP